MGDSRMAWSTERRILGSDLVIVASNLFLFIMMATTFGTTDAWWFGVIIAAIVGSLHAAADRSRLGFWMAVVAAVVAGAIIIWAALNAIVWETVSGDRYMQPLPWLFFGLAVGIGLNRLAFGVLRPIPEARLLRERSN